MTSQATLGQKALEAKDYNAAIKHYTEALKSSSSPLWLMQRSTAYQRSGRHELALYDAEDSVLEAISRQRRELIADAQMRRGIALYSLGRYGDARLCLTWVRKLNEKAKGLGMWQEKVKKDYEALSEDAEGRKITIMETPDKVGREPHGDAVAQAAATNQPSTTAATTPAPVQTPADKIRHEWFQSSNQVTITIFAKNVPKDRADIQFGPQSVCSSLPTTLRLRNVTNLHVSLKSASQPDQKETLISRSHRSMAKST